MGDYDSPQLPSFGCFIYVVPVFVPFLLHICTNIFLIFLISLGRGSLCLSASSLFLLLYANFDSLPSHVCPYSIIHSLLPLFISQVSQERRELWLSSFSLIFFDIKSNPMPWFLSLFCHPFTHLYYGCYLLLLLSICSLT